MRGAIFYTRPESAEEMVEKLIHDYSPFASISLCSKNRIEFDNGDSWNLVPAVFGHCGARYNIAYIERSVSEQYFYSIIMPSLFLRPYNAYRFFGEGDLCVSELPRLPFER